MPTKTLNRAYWNMEIYYDLLWFIQGWIVLKLIKYFPRIETFLMSYKLSFGKSTHFLGYDSKPLKSNRISFTERCEDWSWLTSFHLIDKQKSVMFIKSKKFTYKPGVCLDLHLSNKGNLIGNMKLIEKIMSTPVESLQCHYLPSGISH